MQKTNKRNSRWYILLGIALIIGYVVFQLIAIADSNSSSIDTEEGTPYTENSPSDSLDNAIENYLNYISINTPDEKEIITEEYIANSVLYLTRALKDLSDDELISLSPSAIRQLNQQSQSLYTSDSLQMTDKVKNTFGMISGTLKSIPNHDTNRLEEELNNLQLMAEAFDNNIELEKQDKEISQFLAQTGLVLELIEADV